MSKFETRAVGDVAFSLENGKPRIDARAILFDSWSVDLGGFRERIMPGAVELDPDLVALFDHSTDKVLGRVSAGTMSVNEDARGVAFTAYPPNTTWAQDLRVSMERGDIKGCSFRMIVDQDRWYTEGGMVYRDVQKARVSELTVTSMPAYPATSAEARSAVKAIEQRVGRVLSAQNEDALKAAIEQLQTVLAQLVPADETDSRSITKVKDKPMAEKRDVVDGVMPTLPDLVDELTEAFADVFSFYLRAHGAHWNVVGPNFSEYHSLFGEIYDDVLGSVDPLAENLRKLGAPAPSTLPQIVELRELQDAAVGNQAPALAADLQQANVQVIDSLGDVFDCATALNQQGLANYIAERIDMHQKWAWQLSASLGTDVVDPTVDPMVAGVDPDDAIEEASVLEPMRGARAGEVRAAGGAPATPKRLSPTFVPGFGFIPNKTRKDK